MRLIWDMLYPPKDVQKMERMVQYILQSKNLPAFLPENLRLPSSEKEYCGKFVLLSVIIQCVVNCIVILLECLDFQMSVNAAINVESTTVTKNGKTAYTILMTGYSSTCLYV